METDDFNRRMTQITDDFINNWVGLVDKYVEENEIVSNHAMICFLYAHLGIERALSERVWKMGAKYMSDVIKAGEDLIKNAD